MRNGKTQLLAILLVGIISFVSGISGGVAGVYLADKGILNTEQLLSFINLGEKEEAGLPAEKESIPEKTLPAGNNATHALANEGISADANLTVAESIAEKVLPSVVGISTVSEYTYENSYGFFFGYGGGGNRTYESTAVGTGVIIDARGYILTNSHVIGDGKAKSISVKLYDGNTVPGEVMYYETALDLAVVKIEAENLVAVEIGDSSDLRIGSYAAAIGNPLGLKYERSMSQGIISGMNRTITVSSSSGSSSTTMEGLLQTDATINSGNSGGPLLNSKGQLIGINTAKASTGEGMGFAIPIDVAKPIVESIIDTGAFDRPYIGINGVALEEQKSYSEAQLKEYFGTSKGIYVNSFSEGSKAQDGGLKEGDIITRFEGTEVNTMNKLNSLLIGHEIGDKVELTVLRKGEELTLEIELVGKTTVKM